MPGGRPEVQEATLWAVAEWLAAARQPNGLASFSGRVPYEELAICKDLAVMGVTQDDLDRAEEELQRRGRVQPSPNVPPTQLGGVDAGVAARDTVSDRSRYAFLETLQAATFDDRSDEAALTRLHEAAHACVAVSLGVRVLEVSVLPSAADESWPGSLGHVAHLRLPDPTPGDVWPRSFWVEAEVMTSMAGYVFEELVGGSHLLQPELSADYRHAMAVLRAVERDLKSCRGHFARLRSRTAAFLLQPWLAQEVLRLARHLAHVPRLDGDELYATFYEGRCSAVYPRDRTVRCDVPKPHARGDHSWVEPVRWIAGTSSFTPAGERSVIHWPGFSSGRRESPAALTGAVKRLRLLNDGGPPELSASWLAAIASEVALGIDLTEEDVPTAWCAVGQVDVPPTG